MLTSDIGGDTPPEDKKYLQKSRPQQHPVRLVVQPLCLRAVIAGLRKDLCGSGLRRCEPHILSRIRGLFFKGLFDLSGRSS
ncbi:hypothetical protein [Cryobacterium sp. M91]|uniref:hypothetical protein n=1 Tax=Cryobacterium sp. M91 TaxID=2048294 RepID=UPI0011B0144F|nr:hypothetical protein [Cryobacterium sp. M91]